MRRLFNQFAAFTNEIVNLVLAFRHAFDVFRQRNQFARLGLRRFVQQQIGNFFAVAPVGIQGLPSGPRRVLCRNLCTHQSPCSSCRQERSTLLTSNSTSFFRATGSAEAIRARRSAAHSAASTTPLTKAQILRQQRFAIVHDQHAGGCNRCKPRFASAHRKSAGRSFPRNVKERFEFDVAFGAVLDRLRRCFEVVREVLVKFSVLRFGDFRFAFQPDRLLPN